MRVGVDVDGILANFFTAYENLVIQVAGEDKFGANKYPTLPCTWNWPQFHGYDESTIAEVWTRIKGDTTFWASLEALPGADNFLERLDNSNHEVYFITDRPGIGPQVQTQYWLAQHGYWGPNVIISRKGKGVVCDALSLEVYIDDKPENVSDCFTRAPDTRLFLLDYPYNQASEEGTRVRSLDEFWHQAGL